MDSLNKAESCASTRRPPLQARFLSLRPAYPLLAIITLLLFILVVEALLGWQRLAAGWQQLPFAAQLGALPLLLLSYLLRSWRLHCYFALSLTGHWQPCLRLTLEHNALNSLMPLRSGELSFPLLARRYLHIPLSHGSMALLIMRMQDLLVLSCLLVLLLAPGLWRSLGLAWALLSPLLLYQLGGVIWPQLTHRRWPRLNALARYWPPRTHFNRSYLLSWSNWLLKLAGMSALATWMAGEAPARALLAVVGGELSGLLPVQGPLGIGSYEASAALAVTLHSPISTAMMTAIINLHLLLLLAALVTPLLFVAYLRMRHRA